MASDFSTMTKATGLWPFQYLHPAWNIMWWPKAARDSTAGMTLKWWSKTALMVLGLMAAFYLPGCQSACPNAGINGMTSSEDCVNITMTTTNTTVEDGFNDTALVLDNTTNANISSDIVGNVTEDPGNYHVTTNRPTPTKPDVVDPYDDEERAKREMIVALVVPSVIGVTLLIIACLTIRCIMARNSNGEDSSAPPRRKYHLVFKTKNVR